MAKRMHMHLSVAGILKGDAKFQRTVLRSLLFDGKKATDLRDLRSRLVDLLQSGVAFLPLGVLCEGWTDAAGCPGHEIPDTVVEEESV